MKQTVTGLRAAQKAMTRDRLVDAMHDCLVSRGYVGTTIDDITSEAGATRATFYLHFSSKAEVTRAVWEKFVNEPTNALWETLEGLLVRIESDPAVLQREWFPQVLDHWQLRGTTIRAILHAQIVEPALGDRLLTTRNDVVDLIVGALARHSGRSEVALRIRAIAAFEVQTQVFMGWIENQVPHEPDYVIEALADAWAALLR
ncbi:TetR/AcrR family transcriptional regulator [Microbacterium sp. AGC85]